MGGELALNNNFAPVVGLQYMCSRTYISTERERQRKRGEPLRAWVLMVKTTMFAACRRSASFSWTFPPLMFRAGCLPPTYTLPRACFGKARTPTEARRAAPRLGLYIQDNNVRGVPPLCIVFLDFPSARLIAAERRHKVVRSAKRSLTSIVSLMLRFTREGGSLT